MDFGQGSGMRGGERRRVSARQERIWGCRRALALGKRSGTRAARDAAQVPAFSKGLHPHIPSCRAAYLLPLESIDGGRAYTSMREC